VNFSKVKLTIKTIFCWNIFIPIAINFILIGYYRSWLFDLFFFFTVLHFILFFVFTVIVSFEDKDINHKMLWIMVAFFLPFVMPVYWFTFVKSNSKLN
jgi:hypothetical protein